MKYTDGGVCAPQGFRANGIHCGIRPNISKNDLAVIVSDVKCVSAGLFTKNNVKAAPVYLDIETIKSGSCSAIVANSGIANACAPNDMKNAKIMQETAADDLGLKPEEVLVGSTGIIGQELDVEKVVKGLPELIVGLTHDASGSDSAANAIMTTDTHKKEYACEFEIGGKTVKIGAIAKGSGMIHPNMGTMLCYLTTDAAIDQPVLAASLKKVCDLTFNRISVDGDTSTNDSFIALANGKAGNDKITGEGAALDIFEEALMDICTKIAKDLAGDGEGAHHLITCTVSGTANDSDAELISKSVISSTLTKCAIFANDANWGRVLCAMGYSGASFDPADVEIVFRSEIGSVKVCSGGKGIDFDEVFASEVLSEQEVIIDITAGSGSGTATCWGCDMTYDYVKINGSYRS